MIQIIAYIFQRKQKMNMDWKKMGIPWSEKMIIMI